MFGVQRLIAPAWSSDPLGVVAMYQVEKPTIGGFTFPELATDAVRVGLQSAETAVSHHRLQAAFEVLVVLKVPKPAVEPPPQVGATDHREVRVRSQQGEHEARSAPVGPGDEHGTILGPALGLIGHGVPF